MEFVTLCFMYSLLHKYEQSSVKSNRLHVGEHIDLWKSLEINKFTASTVREKLTENFIKENRICSTASTNLE